MKNNILFFVLVAGMLVMTTGCTPDAFAQTSTPAPGTRAGTPAPNGQINVPGVSIQVNAPNPNPSANQAGANGRIAGFLMGIWHGVISPITLVVSFFNPNVQMYEVHNDGSQYNLGFLVGVAIVFLLLGVTAGSRRRR
jgi:hypothetical protein